MAEKQDPQQQRQQQPAQQQQFQPLQQQPQQQQQVVQHQATGQAHGHPHANLDPRSKEWQHGLFDCFSDMEACLIGYFLPCMLHGRTMDRMNDPSLQTHDPLNTECMIFGGIQCFTCCGWLYNMVKRTEIREKYGIEGSGGGDCGTSYCCLCCALVQQDREVALRASAGVGPITQGYQAQKEGMHMPTQPQQVHAQQYHQYQQQQPQQHIQQQPALQYQQQYQQQQQQDQIQYHQPQQQQQQPMQTGVQSSIDQQMPSYPHEGNYGQKQ